MDKNVNIVNDIDINDINNINDIDKANYVLVLHDKNSNVDTLYFSSTLTIRDAIIDYIKYFYSDSFIIYLLNKYNMSIQDIVKLNNNYHDYLIKYGFNVKCKCVYDGRKEIK